MSAKNEPAVASKPIAQARTGRVEYFDVLRVVAIVAVLVLHTAAKQWYVLPVDSAGWQTLNVFDSAARFCVPIFFMVSGALFLDQNRKVTARSLWRRSLPRLGAAFVVWSAFYAAVNSFIFGEYGGMRDLMTQFAVGYYHLWFLWTLMWLYVATPILRRIVVERSVAVGFVGLALLFSTVLPLTFSLPFFGPIISSVVGTARVDLVLGYTLYFVLGHLLHTGMLARVRTSVLVISFIASIAVTAIGTSLLSARAGVADGTLYAYLTPNVVVSAVCVFLLIKRGVERRPRIASNRVVSVIGNASFGIYLVHPFFQSLFLSFGVTTALLPEVLSVPLFALAMLIPSLIVAVVLQRIPKIGRYLA